MGDFYIGMDGDEYSDVEEFLDYFYSPESLYEARGANLAEDFMDRHGASKFVKLDYILSSVEPNYLELDSSSSHYLLEFALSILDGDTSFRVFQTMDTKHKKAIYDFHLRLPASDFCIILNLYKFTDYPPIVSYGFQKPSEIQAIFKTHNLPYAPMDVLNRISVFTLRQDKNAAGWEIGLWFLIFKYGYELVQNVTKRAETEGFKTDPLSFARIVHNYTSLEQYPFDWILEVSENPFDSKAPKKVDSL